MNFGYRIQVKYKKGVAEPAVTEKGLVKYICSEARRSTWRASAKRMAEERGRRDIVLTPDFIDPSNNRVRFING